MTAAQIDLLRRLIVADRNYWLAVKQNAVHSRRDRGVEVVDPRTAKSLANAGLCEYVDRHVYLGSYDPNRCLDPECSDE